MFEEDFGGVKLPRYQQARWTKDGDKLEPLLFESGGEGRCACSFDFEELKEPNIPDDLLREELNLPELSEPEVVRHFTRLSQMNYGIDSGFCPLGSSTMKYNPKILEKVASLDEARYLHPDQATETVQGALAVMYGLEKLLAEVSGMERVSFQPSAGAHGELLALLIVRSFHRSNGEGDRRSEVIVPDSAHGTNPASATMAGYKVLEVPSDERGRIDLDALRAVVSERTAALMLTNPNTLGLFEDRVEEIVEMVREVGGLLFYDGANLNGILGRVRPGDMEFDIVQFNLHKTFGSPHGGGGPGAGPLGVKKKLVDFLPRPLVEYDEEEGSYYLDGEGDSSVGKVQAYYGNFPILLKAYAYLLSLGSSGLREVSGAAVLNANYIRERLLRVSGYELTHGEDGPCKHETVFSTVSMKTKYGITSEDVAKRILDYGLHAPAHCFPPIVPEALMIEPTETEPKEELDRFVSVLEEISKEADENPEVLRSAPHRTAIGRLDERSATEKPVLSWKMYMNMRDSSCQKVR